MRKFKVTSKLPAYVLPGVFRFELLLTILADKPVDVERWNHSATAVNCSPSQALIKDY
jgi:hypothetical protein